MAKRDRFRHPIRGAEIFLEDEPMKIALINEISQSAKNELIHSTLKKTVEPMGHEVFNYGMRGADDPNPLTYVQNGLLAAILLNAGAVDYVVTGCGSGQGALLACNAFPGVVCGSIVDPTDAYLFAHVNDGNAISLPLAKGFGFGAELNLQFIFEKLFMEGSGKGYPREKVVPQQQNVSILNEIKQITQRDMLTVLKNLDQDFLKRTISGEGFHSHFFENCRDEKIADYLKNYF